ncbi:class I SAM-dependent methyltransferase [Neptuniibacter sp.]|uniref:class I SAM-dependent methyltransferase n=1 Tax=Neptuniibacter sp. TaxID=1962643 RepID=UPI003B5B3F44
MEIAGHYEAHLDSHKIITALQKAYPNGADKYQLAPIDQLHIGGIKASEKLLMNLNSSDKVLEIGSGCGGLMRLMQGQGIDVTGLDISHGLNSLNSQLTSLSKSFKNSGKPNIITGDAHSLPFPDRCFNVVVMQHSLLNMPDRLKVLSECERVLKPSGLVVLHEVFQGTKEIPMLFPVPWASGPEGSSLVTEHVFKKSLNESGFKTDRIEDWTTEALNWRKKQQLKEKAEDVAAAPVSPAMIFGASFEIMASNLVKNLSSGAIRVMEIVLGKLK